MASRVSSASGRSAVLWLIGSSIAMGFGIWSMHFIGMLAFSLPIELGYDVPLTLLSLVIAIACSAFALYLVCQDTLPWGRLLSGGLLMGLGVASMHYIGMEALLMHPYIFYVPWLVGLSIVIAIVASTAALWLAFRLREESKRATFGRIGASLVMGCAIIGMHYTGMAASKFPIDSFCGAANSGIDTKWLAVLVIIVSLAVFAIALIVSMLDVRTSQLSNSLDDAKKQGRNGYCFFEHGMNANVHLQMQMQQNLRQAVGRNELVLHYQPKFVAPDGPMTGLEALLRWQSPDHGFLSPDRFLPLAESSGLIVPIGNWVIEEACRQMKVWYDQGHQEWSVAVNLSAVQLEHHSLVDVVREALRKHSLDPSHLVLEITETTAMCNAETSLTVLNKLSDLGVSISIDDFGTGYSSLLYLKRLPANELKIDRGFITELAQDNDDEAIIQAIIALGKTLDMRIVAEGVETAEQQALLTQLGCNTLQGYLLARPAPPEALLEKIAHMTQRTESALVT